MAQEYVDLSRHLDAGMGHFGQIASRHPNGFHLEPKCAWKDDQSYQRAFRPDMFAIWMPRTCC
jgi:hypothetical protein